MYLKTLLDKAVLTEYPNPAQDVIIIPKGCVPWCDISLTVSRKDWEETYVNFRGVEPDVEMVFSMIANSPSDRFLQKIANEPIARNRYEQLRSEYAEIHESGYEEKTKESVECKPPSLRELALNGVSKPFEEPEQAPNRSSVYFDGKQGEDGADQLESKDITGFLEQNGMYTESAETSEEGPAEQDTIGLNGMIHQFAEEDKVEECSETANNARFDGALDSTEIRAVECNLYIGTIKAQGILDLETRKISNWALPCANYFNTMTLDFVELLKTVEISEVLRASGLTVTAFLEKWRSCNWDDDDDYSNISLDNAEDFLTLLRGAYCDALRFVCYEEEDKAVELTKVFADLIYEG